MLLPPTFAVQFCSHISAAMFTRLTRCEGTLVLVRSRPTPDTRSCSDPSSCRFKALGTTQTQPIQRFHPTPSNQLHQRARMTCHALTPPLNPQVMPPGLDINRPEDWLLPATTYSHSTKESHVRPLHFVVFGSEGNITARPYYEIQEKGQIFTNYPCFP